MDPQAVSTLAKNGLKKLYDNSIAIGDSYL